MCNLFDKGFLEHTIANLPSFNKPSLEYPSCGTCPVKQLYCIRVFIIKIYLYLYDII